MALVIYIIKCVHYTIFFRLLHTFDVQPRVSGAWAD